MRHDRDRSEEIARFQALTEGRGKIEVDTQVLLQKLLDSYGAGIEVRRVQLLAVDPPAQVVDAFNDVQRARADRERERVAVRAREAKVGAEAKVADAG